MPNYEIMLILDPKSEIAIADTIANEVFGSGVKKSEKMERTELAYTINNSNTAIYMLMNIDTEASNISEFNRRVNITKDIWRALVINIDEEKANKIVKPRPERRSFNRDSKYGNRPTGARPARPQTARPQTVRPAVKKPEGK